MSGRVSYLAGLSAEDAVADHYRSLGREILAQRWRGQKGEIDIIARDGASLVFVEVKKSRDFARAAARVSAAQIKRLYATAAEYLGTLPNGQLQDARFDVVLMDEHGQHEIIENALCA